MRTRVAQGFSGQALVNPALENYAKTDELKDRHDNATFDPNPKPVEAGAEPAESPALKLKEDVSQLLEDFTERIVYFEGTLSPETADANNLNFCEIQGPKAGYVWDVRRLTVTLPEYIRGNVTPAAGDKAELYLYTLPSGSLHNSTAGMPVAQIDPYRYTYLTSIIVDGTANTTFLLEPQTFSRLQATVDEMQSLGVFGKVTNPANLGPLVIVGQAVEIPKARLHHIK